ncbi:MAG: twin-arginine translocase TatA/TatE family subunit [Verrucomicrobia bacterium]|nr:MAG: twin-arginine translocase TatA/TatE family subunit [Verrucomicrobiota bacterium]
MPIDSAGILAVLGPLGWPELLVILFVVTLLFGAKRLPELARGFGKSIREFKKATSEIEEDIKEAVEDEPAPAPKKDPKNEAAPPAASRTARSE